MKFREKRDTSVTNLAGGRAYDQSPQLELVSLLLTSFVEDQFYRSKKDQLEKLKKLINDVPDKLFVAKAIAYARNEFGLRSITQAAIVELIPHLKGWQKAHALVRAAIRRPDDILEIVAYWKSNNKGKGLPNILRKGINEAICSFDEYRLAKYRGDRSTVKMVDVFNLTHPKPKTAEQEDLFKRLMTGQLKSVDTWESKLSSAGQQAETEEELKDLKGAAWKELLETKKLGYFALLRNLRNIIQQAPECFDLACQALIDEKEIKKSLVFPFRFITAIEALLELSQTHLSLVAQVKIYVDQALEISLNNVPTFDGSTLIVLDKSGSMIGKPSTMGSLFSAVLLKKNPTAHLMYFDTAAKYVSLDARTPLATLCSLIESNHTQGGTNFHCILPKAQQKYDRIIILSDMQGWMGDHYTPQRELEEYKKKFNADPFIYSFDLQGYGSMQFKSDKVFAIAGFSEKIFNIVKLLEQDKAALNGAICNYEIPIV